MIVAMEKELKQLRPLFPEDKVILQKSGIATVNAAIQTVEMIRQYKPDCIISSGCAGGYGEDINLQDVVVSSELTYHDVYCGKAIDETTVMQIKKVISNGTMRIISADGKIYDATGTQVR